MPVLVFAQDDIPYIKAIIPEFGSLDVDTRAPISIEFSVAMDKKSVEKSFMIFPKVEGEFTWNKNTLIFTPLKPLLPSTSYFVTFNFDIKAQNMIPLALTVFTTPAQAVCVGPEGKINIVSINTDIERVLTEGYNPVWTRDNNSIVYDFEGKIWKIDADGKNKTNLIADEIDYIASEPACNPASVLIAFIGTNQAGAANIYTLESDTLIIRQLTAFFELKAIDCLRWSPDGLYIAFLRDGQIWIMNQDGQNMKKLTTDDLKCKVNFSWSPGGTKIAFTGEKNVWIGDVYSAQLKKISFDNPKTGRLDWSMNNQIVFEGDGMTIIEADGSNEIQVASAGKNPVWINKGAYLSYILPLPADENKAQLWILSANGLMKKKIGMVDLKYSRITWSKQLNKTELFFP
ncbi:MAG: Ig-like domain-containing protein [Candidatus Omnitrophica bacterium]|nr:Ig-like domain-containing protein [Candidatus Omnitrophota bacterium]